MIEALNRKKFIIKGQVGVLKAAKNYDIFDAETDELVMKCREETMGFFTRRFRFSDFKRITPFDIMIRTPDGKPVLRVTRGVPILFSRVKVLDGDNRPIGEFRQRPISISGTFDVLDANDKPLCRLKGRLAGWDFRFLAPNDVELAQVAKKWAGLSKELLTTADHYLLDIDDAVPRDSTLRQLILASLMCIDLVVKA